MTEKRFKMKKLEYDAYFIDSQQEYVDEYVPKFEIDGERTMSDSQILDLLNENEQLKQALLFFLDVANGQCSSSFVKDMEHDCQKLFNCSYSEAKDKYGGYDATWWELGE